MRRFVTHFGPARRTARRFIAGETLDEAIAVVRELNSRGILATLDHLGENVASREDARRAAREYQELLHRIADEEVQSTISVKLTQLGLDLDVEECLANLLRIVERAAESGDLVWIDMEGSAYTDGTLDLTTVAGSITAGNVTTSDDAVMLTSAADILVTGLNVGTAPVTLDAEGATVDVLSGEPVPIRSNGDVVDVEAGQSIHIPS